ncbi:hypothetical protein C0991_012554 [Blastosporella zonata]|nr:hypothetical protein C0991_012554 [Blastosporella zonata]
MGSSPVPWYLPIATLVRPHYALLKSLLLEEGLIDESTIRIPQNKQPRFGKNLYSLQHPFAVNLQVKEVTLCIITEQALAYVRFPYFWRDSRKGVMRNPYSGRLLLRFERSTLPEHSMARIIVIRVIKVLEPITCVIPKYDRIRGGEKQRALKLFTLDLDNPSLKFKSLELLINNDTPSPPSIPPNHDLDDAQ